MFKWEKHNHQPQEVLNTCIYIKDWCYNATIASGEKSTTFSLRLSPLHKMKPIPKTIRLRTNLVEHREEPTSIDLLTGHSVKLTPNDLLIYSKTNTVFNPHLRKPLFAVDGD